ncbi:iron ABC transporter permease [Spirochaetota bacterium]
MVLARKKPDLWSGITIGFVLLFGIFLIYPLFGILRQSVLTPEGEFTLRHFTRFFSQAYYSQTIVNSLKVTVAITIVTLLIGIPFSYFYSFYHLKGAKALFVVSVLNCMSAPFIGAYAWILLLGRSGVITLFFKNVLGIKLGSIYGFSGILVVQALKLYPLVFLYMNGAFKSIDSYLLEASANLGTVGIRRFFRVTLGLTMPTILAASLLVFMRAIADFGTPMLIGEGFRTFPVEIYNQYLGEVGVDYNFASAISVIAIVLTAAVFFLQKYSTGKFQFSMNVTRPVEKKAPKGLRGFFMYLYCYGITAIAFMPQVYVSYLSFRNSDAAVFLEGYSLASYRQAVDKLLVRSINNTIILGLGALAIIIIFSVLIAYLVVRRPGLVNNMIDSFSMLPYIMPGAIIGIAMVVAFSKPPLVLSGTMAIMIISFVIRRMPYSIRSANAILMQIPMNIEEAAISLGSSKLKAFTKITVPMMAPGIISGAILSWVAIVTELSSSIILYNNRNITLTMSTYVAISRGSYGLACAFSAILTLLTSVSLLLYLQISKTEDIKL